MMIEERIWNPTAVQTRRGLPFSARARALMIGNDANVTKAEARPTT